MQVFQSSSVLSVVGSQRKIRSAGVGNVLLLRHDWLNVLSLMGTLGHCKIYRES